MKWRLKEGDGEALYAIGVEDNGSVSGLLKEELDYSLTTLKEMADRWIQINFDSNVRKLWILFFQVFSNLILNVYFRLKGLLNFIFYNA